MSKAGSLFGVIVGSVVSISDDLGAVEGEHNKGKDACAKGNREEAYRHIQRAKGHANQLSKDIDNLGRIVGGRGVDEGFVQYDENGGQIITDDTAPDCNISIAAMGP